MVQAYGVPPERVMVVPHGIEPAVAGDVTPEAELRARYALGDGPVLVPMLQRLLQTGARRLNQETMVACGELSALDRAKQWTSADGSLGKNIALNAGIYRAGERLLAVNRPSAEDDRSLLEPAVAKKLLGTLPLQLLQERTARSDALQGEIWRIFLIGMLAFLFLEAWLVLPNKKPATADPLGTTARTLVDVA